MQILVDGQERSVPETQGLTVGEVLVGIKSSLEGSGRMVVGITRDGELVAPEDLNGVLTEAVDKYSQIEFQTAEPVELAKNSLIACKEFLAQIEGTCREVTMYLHQAQIQSAMEQMGPMFTRLNDAFRGLQGTFQLLKIDPESVELASGHAGKFMTVLVNKLREIKSALENRDYVGLADLFEYELGPVIQEWQELVDHLLEGLSAQE
jgi:hypothetical protein